MSRYLIENDDEYGGNLAIDRTHVYRWMIHSLLRHLSPLSTATEQTSIVVFLGENCKGIYSGSPFELKKLKVGIPCFAMIWVLQKRHFQARALFSASKTVFCLVHLPIFLLGSVDPRCQVIIFEKGPDSSVSCCFQEWTGSRRQSHECCPVRKEKTRHIGKTPAADVKRVGSKWSKYRVIYNPIFDLAHLRWSPYSLSSFEFCGILLYVAFSYLIVILGHKVASDSLVTTWLDSCGCNPLKV